MSMEHVKFEDLEEPMQTKFVDLAASILDQTYFCGRVWSAWSYGTMSQSDFSLAVEDDDFVYEKAEDIYNAMVELDAKQC